METAKVFPFGIPEALGDPRIPEWRSHPATEGNRLKKRASSLQYFVEIGKVTCLELGVDGLPVDRDFKRPSARGDEHELGNRLLQSQ